MAKMILYEKNFKKEAIVSRGCPSAGVCMHAFWSFSGSFQGEWTERGSAVEADPVETFWKESARVCKRDLPRHAPPASRGAADLQATASAADPSRTACLDAKMFKWIRGLHACIHAPMHAPMHAWVHGLEAGWPEC